LSALAAVATRAPLGGGNIVIVHPEGKTCAAAATPTDAWITAHDRVSGAAITNDIVVSLSTAP
jgi:hypothetical protein